MSKRKKKPDKYQEENKKLRGELAECERQREKAQRIANSFRLLIDVIVAECMDEVEERLATLNVKANLEW